MFVRRLYYDTTGAMLHSYMMAGSITVLPADEVAAGLGLTVASHVGAWIEMWIEMMIIKHVGFITPTHPMRVCGLK